MITIYNFPRGARGVRVTWVCEEMGLAYRPQSVGYPIDDAYRARNPLGSVPFLEDDGVAINESVAMMLYLAERYGPTPLLPARNDPACARVLQLTVFGEATLGALMNPLLMARFAAPEADKNNWSVTSGRARAEQAVDYVATVLGDNPFLAGAAFTLADISVSCALDMWEGPLRGKMPGALAGWRARLAARPAYQRAAQAQGGTS